MSKVAAPLNVHYLIELRTRLIYSLIVLFFIFAGCLYFANQLYTLLAQPLLKLLPQGHLIATQIVSPFFVPFKLAFLVALLLSIPFFLYQLWAYVAPALYWQERRLVWPFIFVSSALFYAGIFFAYRIILPLLFHFLANTAPAGVLLTPDITEYFDFTTKLLLIFGSLFEIPMAMILLNVLNVFSLQQYLKWRRYAILGAFILGMLFAPPDVISQTILAVPIWLLYEAGILLTRFVIKQRKGV